MNAYPNSIKENLMRLIREMSASPSLYVKNPGKDFTRNRKLPFEEVVKLLISMGGNSIYKELLESQVYDVNTATSSAFIQQRDKISPAAFEFLLHEFTQSHTEIKKYRGYRLLAVDGSDLHMPMNPFDAETFFQNQPGERGYNLLHMNAMYDLCNRIYVDALTQPKRQENEKGALNTMVDRSSIQDAAIVIADRNFDIPVEFVLTRKRTKEVETQPDIYRLLYQSRTFDFPDMHTNMFYPMSFRVVRFKIADDSYEAILTNLDPADFPPEEIKKLYNMRWGIETSFRELKYAVHSLTESTFIKSILPFLYIFADIFCDLGTIYPHPTLKP